MRHEGARRCPLPKLLAARPPLDAAEERQVRRLARSHHAPADWVRHARMIARSWDGLRTRVIAEELDCPAQTVRERFHAFNERGLDGLGRRPGSGRKPRLTEAERSAVIALVASSPPGRLVTSSDGTLAPAGTAGGDVSEWSLDALAAVAQAQGLPIGRSQIRRILRPGGRPLAPDALLGAEQSQGLRPNRTAVVAGSTEMSSDR